MKLFTPVYNLTFSQRPESLFTAPPESAEAEGSDAGATAEDAPESEPAPAPEPNVMPAKETVVDPELIAMVDRMSHHASLIAAVIAVHTTSGISRFRGAAHIVQSRIQDHRYRYTWEFLRRRGALRKLFVDASAVKMKFDEANEFWSLRHKGADEAEETYNTLLREVASVDRPLYASLARFTYRGTIVHM